MMMVEFEFAERDKQIARIWKYYFSIAC